MGWKIVFWEPTLSPHKTGLVRALAEHPAVEKVELVAHKAISEGRKKQGWSEPNLADGFIVGLEAREIEQRISSSPQDTVHIISGMRGKGTLEVALRSVIKHGRRFGLMSEPRASEGLAGTARYLHSTFTEGPLRRNSSFVLAIGAHGPSWFESTGFNPEIIFPCAYFLPGMPEPIAPRSGKVIVSYLGRLEKEKGIDLFVDAARLFSEHSVARVAGFGSWVENVRAASRETKGRFCYEGVISTVDIRAFLDATDILVVPSRSTNDGWAAVVSEALMRGVALVASEKVGASILLDEPWRGKVVRSDDSNEIARAVNSLINSPILTQSWRLERAKWANARLTTQAGANYLISIVDHIFKNKEKPAPFFF